jgi:Zn-dependent metalloprotease
MAPMNYAVCSIIPPHMLAGIIDSNDCQDDSRDAATHTLTHTDEIRIQRHPGLRQAHSGPPGGQGIVPPHITSHVAQHDEDQGIRAAAEDTTKHDEGIRAARAALGESAAPATTINRKIYSCNGSTRLPGTLIRSEGQKPIGTRDKTRDPDECYEGFGATYDFYKTILGRNSIDDKGLTLTGSVHYSRKYDNAMWDGKQMIFGDGDGVIFNGFTDELDVIGHELTHGVTQYSANLEYEGESGALNESVSDVFGSMIKQYKLKQSASEANWLIGEGILAKSINGTALRSMKAPGTAYNDPKLGGKDPQPDKYAEIVITSNDNGGVHINSGIPNKAFYLAAVGLGGNSWDRAGKIWYQTLTGGKLSSNAQFQDFANLTASVASSLYDSSVRQKVVDAWAGVGIKVSGPSAAEEL